MKKVLKIIIVGLIFYFIICAILKYSPIKEHFLQLLKKTEIPVESHEKILNFLSEIFSLTLSVVGSLIENWLEEKRKSKDIAPYVHMSVTNVSCERKNHTNLSTPIIKLGKENCECFVYITATIKNTGANTISELLIKNKSIVANLESNKSTKIVFCVYKSKLFRNIRFVPFNVNYTDEHGHTYKGTHVLNLNIKKRKAYIKILRKQRRV